MNTHLCQMAVQFNGGSMSVSPTENQSTLRTSLQDHVPSVVATTQFIPSEIWEEAIIAQPAAC
jgi:hypothetical protein